MSCPSKNFLVLLLFFFHSHVIASGPSLYIFIPVNSYIHTKILPFALSGIEAQNYPKDRISVHISLDRYRTGSISDHENELSRRDGLTFDQINAWITSNKENYRDIHLDVNYWGDDEKVVDETNDLEDSRRLDRLTKIRGSAIEKARDRQADFIFFIDAHVVLVNEMVLDTLLRADCPVIAPMIFTSRTATNIWNTVQVENDGNSYSESINTKRKIGEDVFDISMAQSCLLMNLKFRSAENSSGESLLSSVLLRDELNGLFTSVKENGIRMCSTSKAIWGFMLSQLNETNWQENDLNLIDLELEASTKGLMFPESPSMSPFIERPSKDKLGVDKVYVVNLKRRDDRKRAMSKRLEIVGIDAVFWEGVDGETLKEDPTELLKFHVMRQFLEVRGALTYGQFACFLSHYHLWLDALENGYESIIVFEDDIIFRHNFKQEWYQRLESIESYEELNGPVDFVYLGRWVLDINTERASGFSGLVLPGFSLCAHGYLIKRTGIDKIISSNPFANFIPVDELIPLLFDQMLSDNWKAPYPERNLKALSVVPLLVQQMYRIDEEGFTSDTGRSDMVIIDEIYG